MPADYRRRDLPGSFSRRPISVREANAAITQYRKATGDPVGTTDLMLSFVEAGTEQSADLGYGDHGYFTALERKLDAINDMPTSNQRSFAASTAFDSARKLSDGAMATTWTTSWHASNVAHLRWGIGRPLAAPNERLRAFGRFRLLGTIRLASPRPACIA